MNRTNTSEHKNSSKDDQGIEEFRLLEYLAQEFTPPNTVYVNQKVPSEFWVPGSHTISFSSHGLFFLLKIPIRSENHLPFLRLAMGKYGGDTPILRGETPKSKIHRKHHTQWRRSDIRVFTISVCGYSG